jgi:DNA polymerase alpha subunit A
LEVSVDSPEDVSVEKCPIGVKERETPPLVVASINLKTVINHQQNVNEIAAASVVYNKGVKVRGWLILQCWKVKAA